MSNSLRWGAFAILFSVALLGPLQAVAQSKPAANVTVVPGTMATTEGELRARVVELNVENRTITLQPSKGGASTFQVPPDVKNLDKVKVGDVVVLRYVSAVAASVTRGGATAIREKAVTTAGDPLNPRRSTEVLATIQSIDAKNRKVVLRGPTRTVAVDVPADVDIRTLKVGDEVHALIVEAAAISIEPAASLAKPDGDGR